MLRRARVMYPLRRGGEMLAVLTNRCALGVGIICRISEGFCALKVRDRMEDVMSPSFQPAVVSCGCIKTNRSLHTRRYADLNANGVFSALECSLDSNGDPPEQEGTFDSGQKNGGYICEATPPVGAVRQEAQSSRRLQKLSRFALCDWRSVRRHSESDSMVGE